MILGQWGRRVTHMMRLALGIGLVSRRRRPRRSLFDPPITSISCRQMTVDEPLPESKPSAQAARRFESEPATGSDSYWMECEARVEADDESTEVTLTMIAPYREDTLTFFEKLSSMPDGWLGSANWHSECGKLFIDAQGNGNRFATL